MTRTPAEAFFAAIAGRYERSYAPSSSVSRARMGRVLARLAAQVPPPARVLDLGVGTGRELSALLDAGYEPTGLDASERMLERCARRARPVPLVRADFWEPLPFDAGAFDAALALHGTLAHPPHDAGEGGARAVQRLARELARVVRPGGRLVIEVPSPAWLDAMDDSARDTLSRPAYPSASHSASGDRSVRRTGPRTCVYEDLVTGASIEASLLDADGWRAALAPGWDAAVEAIDGVEWLIASTRVP